MFSWNKNLNKDVFFYQIIVWYKLDWKGVCLLRVTATQEGVCLFWFWLDNTHEGVFVSVQQQNPKGCVWLILVERKAPTGMFVSMRVSHKTTRGGIYLAWYTTTPKGWRSCLVCTRSIPHGLFCFTRVSRNTRKDLCLCSRFTTVNTKGCDCFLFTAAKGCVLASVSSEKTTRVRCLSLFFQLLSSSNITYY